MDLAIRMATECGATHIHPTVMTRSIAKGDRAERWARIATSAAKQCKRAKPPVILPLSTLRTIADCIPAKRYIAVPTTNNEPDSHTEPGAKGNSTGNVQKPATVETGAELMVPIFINNDDVVRVDTRTGEYVERVSKG